MIPRVSDLLAAARRMKAAAGEGTRECIEKGAKTVPAVGVSIAVGGWTLRAAPSFVLFGDGSHLRRRDAVGYARASACEGPQCRRLIDSCSQRGSAPNRAG
jgi:hypothetical protein